MRASRRTMPHERGIVIATTPPNCDEPWTPVEPKIFVDGAPLAARASG